MSPFPISKINEVNTILLVCIHFYDNTISLPILTHTYTSAAGQDYEAITEIVQLTSKSDQLEECQTCFTIPVISDDVEESDEFFIVHVTASDVGVIIQESTATVRISNISKWYTVTSDNN